MSQVCAIGLIVNIMTTKCPHYFDRYDKIISQSEKHCVCFSNGNILTLWTRLVHMWTNSWVWQKPEWENMFCQEKLTYPTGLHADHHVNGFVYIREPSSHYFNCFIWVLHCKCGTNWAKNNLKTDPKWWKSGWKQNKQEIIYLNEYLSDSYGMKGEFSFRVDSRDL